MHLELFCSAIKGIKEDEYICRPCRQDIPRVLSDTNYIPRWGKKTDEKCCIKQCRESVFSAYNLADTTLEVISKCKLRCEEVCENRYKPIHNTHLGNEEAGWVISVGEYLKVLPGANLTEAEAGEG